MSRAGKLPLLVAFLAGSAIVPAWGAPKPPAPKPPERKPASAALPQAQDLLRASIDAPKTCSYVGEVQSTRWGADGANATIAQIDHEAPDRTRRLYVAPESAYGNYVVTVGRTSYVFDVRRNRLVQTQNPALDSQVALNDNFALMIANYRPVMGPVETIAGRNAASVWLVNKHTGARAMRVWIDTQTKLILAKETYRANGAVATRVRFDEIRYTNDIPQDMFSMNVPSGFRIVVGYRFSPLSTDIDRTMQSAGFPALGPRYLPEGFSILSANVTELNSVRTLHLIYSDGIRMVSLFENASDAPADFGSAHPADTRVENHDAQFIKEGPMTLLAWHDHGLSFALVGDLDLSELTAIASSVAP